MKFVKLVKNEFAFGKIDPTPHLLISSGKKKNVKQQQQHTMKSFDHLNQRKVLMSREDSSINDKTPQNEIQQQQQQQQLKKIYFSCPCCAPIHIMNKRMDDSNLPPFFETYEPSPMEELANVLSHFIPAIFSIFILQYTLRTVVNTKKEFVSALIYGGCCILLFTVSSVYHLTGLLFGYGNRLNLILQKADHTMIYAFIASSYTPWLLLVDFVIGNFSMSQAFMVIIWSIAIFGLLKSCANLFPKWNLTLYLTMGWISVLYAIMFGVSILFGLFETKLHYWGLVELCIGGLFYTVGACVFFRLDGTMPFAHATWHLFTVAAAACHYHAVHVYVMTIN